MYKLENLRTVYRNEIQGWPAAWEIARELSLAGAEDEAALFGGGVAESVA